ncbi:MAG: hypothetical protein ACRDU8_08485, partial [Egibacteraceae bacterium]
EVSAVSTTTGADMTWMTGSSLGIAGRLQVLLAPSRPAGRGQTARRSRWGTPQRLRMTWNWRLAPYSVKKPESSSRLGIVSSLASAASSDTGSTRPTQSAKRSPWPRSAA